jgi:hypothetical protein
MLAGTIAGLALAAAGTRVEAQAGFEGVATFIMRDKQGLKADTVQQTTKGKSVRMDGMGRTGKGGGGMVIDGEKKRFIIIDDADKSAMIMSAADQEKMKAMTDGLGANRPKRTPPSATTDKGMDIVKTGRTETVAGVRCEVYHGVSTDKGEKSEGDICVADGVGFGMFSAIASNPMFQQTRNKEFEQFRKILGEGKGVIKATSIENGKSYVSLELIKLDKKSVSSAVFEPPAGYQVRNMGDVMQGATDAIEKMKKARSGKPPR